MQILNVTSLAGGPPHRAYAHPHYPGLYYAFLSFGSGRYGGEAWNVQVELQDVSYGLERLLPGHLVDVDVTVDDEYVLQLLLAFLPNRHRLGQGRARRLRDGRPSFDLFSLHLS